MSDKLLDPELRAALDKVAAIEAELPRPAPGLDAMRAHVAEVGAWWQQGGPLLASETEVEVPIGDHPLEAVVYRARAGAASPAFVYLHGGGFRFGNARSNARQLREIAHRWGGAVISLDYPHIPEGPFPAAVEAVSNALEWLAQNAGEWGLDGSRLALGGSSAGANIACGAAVHLGERSKAFPRALALVVPVFGGGVDTDSMQAFAEGPHFPTRAATIETWRAYVGDGIHRTDPRAEITLADPTLFPPTFMAVAELDPFRDGARAMAGSLAANGVEHRLQIYPGMTHLFFGYSRMVGKARAACADIAGFLDTHLPA